MDKILEYPLENAVPDDARKVKISSQRLMEAFFRGYEDYARSSFGKGFPYKDEFNSLVKATPKILDGPGIGVEIEVEGINPSFSGFYPGKYMQWHKDGSLKDRGVEFITIPSTPQLTKDVLCALWSSMKLWNTNAPIFEWRSSTHVHLDVRKKNYKYLYCLLLTYFVFEETLFEYAGRGRKHTNFCVPISQCDHVPTLLQQVGCGQTHPFELIQSWRKYSALNLIPIMQHGTIEFRQLAGTDDLSRILNWINLILRLDSFATTVTVEELSSLILDLNTSSQYDVFKSIVFKEHRHLLQDDHLAQNMSDGTKYAKLCLEKYENPVKEIKKIEQSDALMYIAGDPEPNIEKSKRTAKKPRTSLTGVYGNNFDAKPLGALADAYGYIVHDEFALEEHNAALKKILDDKALKIMQKDMAQVPKKKQEPNF